MKYIVDSNVLIDFPNIIQKRLDDVIISFDVLKELDGLKMSINSDVASKARRAAVMISHYFPSLHFNSDYEKKIMPVDDKLIELAKATPDGVLVTNDVYLKIKAKVAGVKTEGYSWKNDYNGVYYVDVENLSCEQYSEMLNEILEKGTYKVDNYTFSNNEYLVVPSPMNDPKLGAPSVFRFKDDKFVPVKIKTFETMENGQIHPRNLEQLCLVDSLFNEDVKIIYASGKFGTGKTFLTHNYAIRELYKETINKIIYVPNNSYTQNTLDLGALPGTLYEKIYPSIGPLIDIAGTDQIERWLNEERLEIVPIAYIRGRSFSNSIIIVSEAQNLTEDHIKLLISRCGDNTRIFFDGDIPQADSAIFKDRNGLKLLLNLHESPIYSKIFSTVKLKRIERSLTACAADYLDNL